MSDGSSGSERPEPTIGRIAMTTQADPAATPEQPAPLAGRRDAQEDRSTTGRRRFRYTLPGAWVALAFICLSFTPWLLPRPARPARPRSWRLFFIIAPFLLLVSYLLGLRWQLQIRELMSVPAEGVLTQLLLPLAAGLVFVGLVALARGIRALFRLIAGLLGRWMGRRAARGVGWVLVAGLTVLIVSGVLLDGAIGVADRSFAV